MPISAVARPCAGAAERRAIPAADRGSRPGRCRPEFVDGIVEDLRWLGLDWDGEPLVQSRADAALRRSARAAEGARAWSIPASAPAPTSPPSLTAPHGDAGAAYPGTCRGLPDDPERRATTPHSWRLDSAQGAGAGRPAELDARTTAARSPPTRSDIGDAILARKDAPASYHLACVVDDAASGVTLVVRGDDLRPSTPIQRLLQALLGLPEPTYLHHPLVTHDDGRRLAKRDLAPTLAAMREAGVDGPRARRRPARRQAAPWFRLRPRRRGGAMNDLPDHPARRRHGRDRLRPGPRGHRHGLGQGRHRRAAAELDAQARPVPGASRSSSSSLILIARQRPGLSPTLVKLNKIYTRTGDARRDRAGRRLARRQGPSADGRRSARSTRPIARSASRLLHVDGRGRAAMLGADPERAVRPRRRPRHAGRGVRAVE